MNTKNNKRRKLSQEKIMTIFADLLQQKALQQITVAEICRLAGLNRSTFYANYLDTYDLAEKFKLDLAQQVIEVYKEERRQRLNSGNFVKLFQHIKGHQVLYKAYFSLGFLDDTNDISLIGFNTNLPNSNTFAYHQAFFQAGLNALIKQWLNTGCKESPEELNKILQAELANGL